MNTQELSQNLLKLREILFAMNSNEIGWIFSATRHSVNYENQAAREEIQRKLDHAVGGVSIVYLFALFENYFDRSYWSIMEDNERDRIEAFRHVRHSIAHGFNGKRANRLRDEFDMIMNSNNPIKSVLFYDTDQTILDANAGLELLDYLLKIVTKYISVVDRM